MARTGAVLNLGLSHYGNATNCPATQPRVLAPAGNDGRFQRADSSLMQRLVVPISHIFRRDPDAAVERDFAKIEFLGGDVLEHIDILR